MSGLLPVDSWQFLLWQLVGIERGGPRLDVHHVARLLGLEQLDDRGGGQDHDGLGDVDDHPDGGQGGL